MEMDIDLKPAWEAFMEAAEVKDTVEAYQTLRAACRVPAEADGRGESLALVEGSRTRAERSRYLVTCLHRGPCFSHHRESSGRAAAPRTHTHTRSVFADLLLEREKTMIIGLS